MSLVRLLLGDEEVLVRAAEEAAVASALPEGTNGFNHQRFSAGENGLDALSIARTQPMMCQRRVVVIREMERANVELLEALAGYLDSPNPSTVLLLVGRKLPEAVGGVDRGKRLENRLKKDNAVQRFAAKDVNPRAWVTEHCAKAGSKLDPRAAELLVELVGADLGRLGTEADKAIAWVGKGGLIQVSTIEEVCSVVAEAVIWDLTDALVSGNVDKALSTALRMMEDAAPGEGSTHQMLGLVAWQLRRLLELQSALRAGGGLPEAWTRMPSAKLRAAKEMLARRPLDPARTMEALVTANRNLNRSAAGDQRVFERLILNLTLGEGPA
jgi:DNA polymerase-3 subunit delta